MKRSIPTRLAVGLAGVLLAYVPNANAQSLSIQSATVNASQTVLSISGTNYCVAPTVTLGGTSLAVQAATPTLVTVTLPPALASGSYYLVVSCGTLAGRTVYFNVFIGTTASAGADGACFSTGQRYTDCGNGTVTDAVTGLIWLKDAGCAELATSAFAIANTAASGLHSGQCGLSDGSAAGDWRLPSKTEWLATITANNLIPTFLPSSAWCHGPSLTANNGIACYAGAAAGPGANQHAFVNVVSGGYWSSSVYELDATFAYLADLSATNLANANAVVPRFQGNSLSLNVWPVRNPSR